jgi:hypothetical protein
MGIRMSITKLSAETLLLETELLAQEERRITLELLDHLREIERRMLYADLGYGSLHDFCVKHLALSEGSAQRRIQAMRLARELPEIKTAILDGNLSLTNAAKLQTVFQAQKRLARETKGPTHEGPVSNSAYGAKIGLELGIEEKREVLREITGLTQKECEAKLQTLLPSALAEMNREKTRRLGENATELRLVLSDPLLKKIGRLKELLSHSIPSGSVLEIIERLTDAELARLEKKRGLIPKDTDKAPNDSLQDLPGTAPVPIEANDSGTSHRSSTSTSNSTPRSISPCPGSATREVAKKNTSIRNAIPSGTAREVWRRAKGACEIPGCGSRFLLEIDHRTPRAFDGSNEPTNLRLLCRTHNLSEARRKLGEEIMEKYLDRLRA